MKTTQPIGQRVENSDQAPYAFMSEALPIQPIYLVYHFTPSIKIYTDSCLYISISLSKEEGGVFLQDFEVLAVVFWNVMLRCWVSS
jgi:hypothetical protein